MALNVLVLDRATMSVGSYRQRRRKFIRLHPVAAKHVAERIVVKLKDKSASRAWWTAAAHRPLARRGSTNASEAIEALKTPPP